MRFSAYKPRDTLSTAWYGGSAVDAVSSTHGDLSIVEDRRIAKIHLEVLGLQLHQSRLMLEKVDSSGSLRDSDWAGISSVICESLEAVLSHAVEIVYGPQKKPVVVSDVLNQRQKDVLGMLAKGMTNRELSVALGVSESTVSQMLTAMYRLLGVGSRTQAVAWYNRHTR